jgi:hypothetical protein
VFFSSDIILVKYPKMFIYQNCFVNLILANEIISLINIFDLLFPSTINVVLIFVELS